MNQIALHLKYFTKIFFLLAAMLFFTSTPKIFAQSVDLLAQDIKACTDSGGKWDSVNSKCLPATATNTAQAATGSCDGGSFFGLPSWHKYLRKVEYESEVGRICQPQISNLWDILLIVAAVVEILIRIGTITAVIFVLWGGITYITSQGEPDKTKQALKMIISALVGVVISIAATAIISFAAGRFNR